MVSLGEALLERGMRCKQTKFGEIVWATLKLVSCRSIIPVLPIHVFNGCIIPIASSVVQSNFRQ